MSTLFNHVHSSKQEGGMPLAFINSSYILAFPCGTRRAELANQSYIPYDPEARLNTEANNRKHTGLNGFTQSYIKEAFENGELSLVLDGYLFRINTESVEAFVNAFTDMLPDDSATNIYANIRVAKVKLYEGFENYFTEVLRDQTAEIDPLASIDVNTDVNGGYYFSGLSFSTSPLTKEDNEENTEGLVVSEKREDTSRIISLNILKKVTTDDGISSWQVNQEALLPDIKHGATADSIKVGTVYADNIVQNGGKVVTLKPELTDHGTYQLQFSFGK
jgi:hypothetical protein